MKNFVVAKVRVGYILACVVSSVFMASPVAFARPIGSVGTWANNTNTMPTAAVAAASIAYHGYIYVLGGDTNSGRLDTVYYARLNADGTTGTWTTNTISLPNPMINEGAVVVNGYIYLIGGFGSYFQNTVYYAKINTDGSVGAWTTSAHNLPQIKSRAATVYSNGYIYVLGGENDSGLPDNIIYYTKVNADASINAWTTSTTSLPVALQDTASFVANGYIYILGGINNSGATNTIYYAKLNTNGTLGSWSTNNTNLPQALEYHVGAKSNGYVYIAGGRNGSNIEQDAVYYSQINTDASIGTWISSPNHLPQALEASTSVVYGGYWYVISGQFTGTVKNVIYSTQLGFISTDTIAAASSSAQITLTAPAGTNITSLTSAAVDTSAATNGFSYPLDLVNFTFATDAIDNQVSLDFPTTLQPSQVVARKYNSTTKTYTTIPDAIITQTTVGGEPALHVTYTITDGGPLDSDGAANGTIVDPVTLGIPPPSADTLADTGISALLFSVISACMLAAATMTHTYRFSPSTVRKH
ncbi:MAG TPA: choice-of-anchor U domain-containing protein [Candidatus Saccharimonadia bacterium]|nr:choice-of-anchor U domain-containing protein [Candidatus Saccharimonadia bacterium]